MPLTQASAVNPVDYLIDLYSRRGAENYYGEAINQIEHALQAAQSAQLAHSDEPTIIAALLHDVGHLLDGEAEQARLVEMDRYHEKLGEAWLARHFPPAVTEPVGLHVAAKRYLCASDSGYYDQLSDASQQSLAMQGGPMNQQEVDEFLALAHSQAAVSIRRWDDQAKRVAWVTPPLEEFRPLLDRLVLQ